MTELLTAAQMRAIEQAAIASGEVTGLELMERAGRGVVEAEFAEWPELAKTSHRAVVLCGPGGNGGDGFVVARLLTEWGWEVEVFLYGDPERMPPDARVNYERWCRLAKMIPPSFPDAGEVRRTFVGADEVETFTDVVYGIGGTDLIVDAVFGIGLTRPMTCTLGADYGLTPARRVSVDLPSGVFSNNPEASGNGTWFHADLTVTFHRMKPAHVHPLTALSCGKVVVVDIGLEPWHTAAGRPA
jgi:ADP-dependent NAD(P)H-hydrate dehydratase / NAD(P)H-hydrate epimerase